MNANTSPPQIIGHGAKFERKQEDAIAALLTKHNTEEAARSIGVSPKTLLRWMQQPEFDKAYREARRAAFRQTISRLQQASSAAVTTLFRIMVDPATPPAIKARAADSILNHCAKAIEMEDIQARVAELEQAVASPNQAEKAHPVVIGHGAKSERKEEAIAALLTQRNTEEAARFIGVSPKTLLRWMQQPEFDKAFREAWRAAFRQCTARLQQASPAAVTTLIKVMVDPDTPPAVKARAAGSILKHCGEAIEMEDIEARVAQLERAVASKDDPQPMRRVA